MPDAGTLKSLMEALHALAYPLWLGSADSDPHQFHVLRKHYRISKHTIVHGLDVGWTTESTTDAAAGCWLVLRFDLSGPRDVPASNSGW
jgi:hypothetical protein